MTPLQPSQNLSNNANNKTEGIIMNNLSYNSILLISIHGNLKERRGGHFSKAVINGFKNEKKTEYIVLKSVLIIILFILLSFYFQHLL